MSKKYNRSYHLPFSLGCSSDDKMMDDVSELLNKEVVISEKMDGGNVCLERHNCYARTHSGPPTHTSFDLFKSIHSSVKHLIPENLELFGEFLYAKHSIYYDKLPAYLMLFNVRDLTSDLWLSWEEVELWAEEIQVPTVPVLHRGVFNSVNDLKLKINEFMSMPSCFGKERGALLLG